MSKIWSGQNFNISISGDQSEVSEKQDGPNSWGDKEVHTGEGKLTIKILLKSISHESEQVAAKTGTDQTIFDGAQQEVRNSDKLAVSMFVIEIWIDYHDLR